MIQTERMKETFKVAIKHQPKINDSCYEASRLVPCANLIVVKPQYDHGMTKLLHLYSDNYWKTDGSGASVCSSCSSWLGCWKLIEMNRQLFAQGSKFNSQEVY